MNMSKLAYIIKRKAASLSPAWLVGFIASLAAVASTALALKQGTIVAYGDAESHLNIAKRVVDSITPGFAQLGGIWLPLPHVMMLPFVINDFLWRTGLAGSIVSGICFIVSAIFIYKTVMVLVDEEAPAVFAAFIFIVNPNILYMQATPMTELTLIMFFILSSYYFIRFLKDSSSPLLLVAAAFFGFCATLSRYDGWGLVLMEAGVIFLMYIPWRSRKSAPAIIRASDLSGSPRSTSATAAPLAAAEPWTPPRRSWNDFEGVLILFLTLAVFGVLLWLLWDWLILGDPLYFTHSPFSAKSQQQSWLERGELPAYNHILVAIEYYAYTSMDNVGIFISELTLAGCAVFLFTRRAKARLYVILILLVPFIFNVAALYLGQSVIFIPGLTPKSYPWPLFNARYGVLMVPFAAVFVGYLMYRARNRWLKGLVAAGVALQCAVFAMGYAPVITLADGTTGLSSEVAKVSDAQLFMEKNYDHGMILADDYSRAISIVRIPNLSMKDDIYIGNKPYWEQSLVHPELYARWIIMQKNDAVWTAIYDNPTIRDRLFKYFNKVYTSNDIYIFKRMSG